MELHPFRRERLLRGLTQQQCSKKTGISQSKISLIEQGFVLPTTEVDPILRTKIGSC